MIPIGTQPTAPKVGGLQPLAKPGMMPGAGGTGMGGPSIQPGQRPHGPSVLPQAGMGGPTITPKPPITPQAMSAPQLTGQAPDRMALVNSALSDYDAQNAPGLAMRQRQVGQNAAKFGRIGAGMTTNDLTGLARGYEKDRQLFGNGLIRGGIEGTIGDQQTAIDNAFRRLLVGDQLQNSGVSRNVMAGQYGAQGSPAGLEAGFSQQHAGAASDAFGSIADLMKQYMLKQGTSPYDATGTPTPYFPPMGSR